MKELKRLWPYIKRYKTSFLLGILTVTISNLCSTYAPRIVGGAIDTISRHSFTMSSVLTSIGFLLALTAGSGFFMFLTRQTIIVASRKIEYDLRSDLLTFISNQSMNFFHRNSTGSLMAFATNDIPAAREFIGPAIMYSANTVTTFFFALYFMLNLNSTITAIALIPLPIIAVATYFAGKKVHIAFREVQEKYSDLTGLAQETISGVRVIRSYVRERNEKKMFDAESRVYLKKNLRLARIEALMMPLLMVLIGLSQLSVLGFGGMMVIDGKASLGDLTQFFIYVNLLIWPVAAIGWVTNLVQRAAASAGRLGKLMDEMPEYNDDVDAIDNIEIKGTIEFDNVTFQYMENLPVVLEGVSFKIQHGKTLGVIGEVGSGKSTIVSLIPRLYEVNSGQIKIDGFDLKKIKSNILRKAIGIVPQDTFLFSDTISENIKFGKPDATEEEILAASKAAMLHEEVIGFEEGYETILGERGISLSGGQRQRCAIARAIISDPPILVLDDSLSAVDTNTEEAILTNFRKLRKGKTNIIISHRISAVKDADMIITMENGKIVERGTHDELILNNGIYASIYDRQKIEEEISNLE